MRTRIFLLSLLLPALFAAETALAATYPRLDPRLPLERIVFGSCLDEEKTPPRWQTLLDRDPQLFMMLGDNVYADSVGVSDVGPDLVEMRRAYAALDAQAGFRDLRSKVPLLAVWDDHDYGLNDGGEENPIKVEAKSIFADFFDVSADDPMRLREGIYRAGIYGPTGHRVQIILLDTRYFRSPLKPTDQRNAPGKQRFVPDDDPKKTILGEAQWQWLEEQLRQPAELRFIVSSIQVIAEGHGWEGWRMMPLERTRLTRLINETKANGVIFLSGDRHRAAAYRRVEGTPYPFYELTSSSLNSGIESRQPEIDPQRLGGGLYAGENFGMVQIDWELGVVSLDILSLSAGRRVRGVTLAIAELRP
ncbi:MAG: alkaline phosphatase family protein [Gammaproteobacteria bacterium]|nr:alkaline phosphatase family protein [Gammaproteobacteria bacterium]